MQFISSLQLLLVIIGAFIFGGGSVWLLTRGQSRYGTTGDAEQAALLERLALREERLNTLEQETKGLRQDNTQLHAQISQLSTQLKEERKSAEEKLALIASAEAKLTDTFKALSSDALRSNNQSFLELAKTAVMKPVKESLDKVDGKIAELEKARSEAYGSLAEQLKAIGTSNSQLQKETANLVKALRAPQVRGRWGEIQLRRVVEMAGMLEYCDFVTQESVNTTDGRLRPDLVVRLPNERNIIVDAKAPLQAYLEALEAEDDMLKAAHLKNHAAQIRTHISQLAKKSYWEQFNPAPEFAVLFIPGDIFFSAALEHDPTLIEFGVDQQVIVATPSTLIALLKAVSYGWRQEKLAESANEIRKLGQELHERVRSFVANLSGIGRGLQQSVASYNRAIGSLERRVLPAARRFKDLGAGTGEEIPELEQIEVSPQGTSAIEFSSELPNVEQTVSREES